MFDKGQFGLLDLLGEVDPCGGIPGDDPATPG